MTVEFRPGRLAPDPSKPRLKLAPFLDVAAVVAPQSADYVSAAGPYPMDANDQWGCCTAAGIAHQVQAVSRYGQHATVVPTVADVLKVYADVTGFNPNAGPPGSNPTDQGAVMADVENYWRKTGIAGHRSLAFAEVDIHDLDHVRAAIATFGGIQVGVNLPASAMRQFNAGHPWDVVASDGGILGGHAIHVGGYDTTSGTFILTTWGRVTTMSERWWRTYVEESWAVVTPEFLDATGRTPAGLDLAGLGAAFSELTGKPSPFPGPVTPPVVPPVPTGDPVDVALAAAVKPWVGKRHTGGNAAVARAVKAWLAAKGL